MTQMQYDSTAFCLFSVFKKSLNEVVTISVKALIHEYTCPLVGH